MVALTACFIFLALAFEGVKGTPIPVRGANLIANAAKQAARANQQTITSAARASARSSFSRLPPVGQLPPPAAVRASTSQVLGEMGTNAMKKGAVALMIGGGATYVTNSLEAKKRSLEKRSLERRIGGAATRVAMGAGRAALQAAAETAPRVARVRGGGPRLASMPSPGPRISQQTRLPHSPIMSPPQLPSQPSTLTKLAAKMAEAGTKARDGSTTALGTFAFAGFAGAAGEGVGGFVGNKVSVNMDAAEEKKASLNARSLPESSFQTLSRRTKGLQLGKTTSRIVTSAARQAVRSPIPKPNLPARPITPPPVPRLNFNANQRFAIAASGGVAAFGAAALENGVQTITGDSDRDRLKHLMTPQGIKEAFYGADAVPDKVD